MELTLERLNNWHKSMSSISGVVYYAMSLIEEAPEVPKKPINKLDYHGIKLSNHTEYEVWVIDTPADLARFEQAVEQYRNDVATYPIRLDKYNEQKTKSIECIYTFLVLNSTVSKIPKSIQNHMVQAAKLLSNGDFIVFHQTLNTICSVFPEQQIP